MKTIWMKTTKTELNLLKAHDVKSTDSFWYPWKRMLIQQLVTENCFTKTPGKTPRDLYQNSS